MFFSFQLIRNKHKLNILNTVQFKSNWFRGFISLDKIMQKRPLWAVYNGRSARFQIDVIRLEWNVSLFLGPTNFFFFFSIPAQLPICLFNIWYSNIKQTPSSCRICTHYTTHVYFKRHYIEKTISEDIYECFLIWELFHLPTKSIL